MARAHIINLPLERRLEVTLSRRNLLALLHKLDMESSERTLLNNDVYEDGEQVPLNSTILVLKCENDDEHYNKRPTPPGLMHPATERDIREKGAIPGSIVFSVGGGLAVRVDVNLADEEETS